MSSQKAVKLSVGQMDRSAAIDERHFALRATVNSIPRNSSDTGNTQVQSYPRSVAVQFLSLQKLL